MGERNVYQFTARTLQGEKVCLDRYRGKVLLIVNTASECGFTPQYKDLQVLKDRYGARGFEILAFPSDDFNGQEPLEGDAIQRFCELNYGVEFPVFDKIHVKGAEAHPLFAFLGSKNRNGKISEVPRWNFYKYLINRQGEVVDFFYSFTKPGSSRVIRRIERLLDTH